MGGGITGPAASREQEQAFTAMLESRSAHTQALAREARGLIREVMPGVIEILWDKQGTASYGTGPKKMSQHFCYFTFAKKHLGFGFYYGAELDDPHGLLQGSGKKMRRVKIEDAEQLSAPPFQALLRAASSHRVPPLEG